MNKALEILCDAITQLLSSYSSVANVSFILVIGKNFQGKTCLLRQSSLVYYPHELKTKQKTYSTTTPPHQQVDQTRECAA